MIRTIALAAASALVVASGALAADEEVYEKYGEANGWTIWANMTSMGCFLENRNNNGNTVQLGIRSNNAEVGFMGVWNHEQAIMQPGDTLEMTLDIDGKPYSFTAEANVVSEGMTGGFMYFNSANFISDLENGKVMTVNSPAGAFEVDLTGTKAGIGMARECFASINS